MSFGRRVCMGELWEMLPGSAMKAMNGRTGVISATKASIDTAN